MYRLLDTPFKTYDLASHGKIGYIFVTQMIKEHLETETVYQLSQHIIS